jgi:hypothetical protein
MIPIREALPRRKARITGPRLFGLLSDGNTRPVPDRPQTYYGNATNLIATSCYVVLTLLFYFMFKPVNRGLSLLAALLSLAGCVLMTLDVFHPDSIPISPLLFFGPYCLLIGYLIFRSTFLPRILGVLMALAGLGWLVFLLPTLPKYLSFSIEGLGILAEASLMIWLIVMGVKVQGWKEQASAA